MSGNRYLCILLISILFLVSVGQPSFSQESELENAKVLKQQMDSLYQQGRYADAIPIAEKVLAIWEKAFGSEHPDVAEILNDSGMLYYSLGDYGQAEPLYERSLEIWKKSLGSEHPRVALSLNNLSALYCSLGDYAKAEPLLQRSLLIREKALGSDHPDVGESLNNLAELYRTIGDYSQAEPLYERSLEIWKKSLGPEHPGVALILNNLAGFYCSLGDYAKAEPLLQRSLSIKEKALGSDHPGVAVSLNNLAEIYRTIGDYGRAESLYERSLEIWKKALGPDHPDVAQSLNNLAGLYAELDNFQKAHDLSKKAQWIDSKLIDQVLGFTSEDQKIKFLSIKMGSLYAFISLIDQHLSDNPAARKDALDVWLKRKGVILETQKRFQEALIYSDDPQAVETFQKLSRVRSQLSKLAFSGPGKESPDAYKKKISALEREKGKFEARLSQLSQAYALKKKIARANCEKVAKALPENTVLLEFARVGMFNFKAKGKEKRWSPAHYLAFILHAGKEDKVGLVDLGDAEEIDKTIAEFKEEILDFRDITDITAFTSSKKIYELIFKPIKKELGDVKEIFISPDGNLSLIPFEVIQDPDGRYLIEDYTFNYLAAGRDIIGFDQIKEKGGKALLMGDPDFDIGNEDKNSILRKLALRKGEEEFIAKRSTDMRGFHFNRLPGTREEVEAIQALLGEDKSELYTGKEALEEILRQRETPSILHLATHGFFKPDLDLSDLRDETFGRGLQQLSIFPKPGGKRVKIENPLLRSGIALAGANNTLKFEDAEKSDGIVTAEKILGLRLRGTDMVVLSACDTGVGEVKTGEGVFGLRRAFTQAGAKSLVMSMWSVPDQETKELMIEFYKNILSGKMNRCQALRQAALKEMKIVQERYGHTNPFYWGAFVFMGEP